MNTTTTAVQAVRTPTGTKIHTAIVGGSSTTCGLRVKKLHAVDISKAQETSRCERCCYWTKVS